jgi:LPS sulfotransferase NodH
MLLFLWCVPRSVSTAFEKMMDCRGDIEVFGEPYLHVFKAERNRFGEVPPTVKLADRTSIDTHLLQASKSKDVFVKEMTYHVAGRIDQAILASAVHTFLVRSPRRTIASLYRIKPQYTSEETGFLASRELFENLSARQGIPPLVLDGDQLIQNPVQAVSRYCKAVGLPFDARHLRWQPGSRQDWAGREDWHQRAIDSGGFDDTRKPTSDELPPHVLSDIINNECHYNYMMQFSALDRE